MDLYGSIVALVTPFNSDGSVNFTKLKDLVRWHIDEGTDAILPLGTTGESSTMSHEEDAKVVETCLEVAHGQVPIIAGSGSNSTETMLEKSKEYEKIGADGLLLITPYYNKSNEEGIFLHFATVLEQVKIPCILYNVPSRTGCSIPLSIVDRLKQYPSCYALKEASGDLSYASEAARYLEDNFRMFSGNDDIIVPMMSIGSSGVISVLANVLPALVRDITHLWKNGEIETSRQLQLKYLPFINALFYEVNPIPIKEAMNLAGLEVGGYRLPLTRMSEKARGKLEKIMHELKII